MKVIVRVATPEWMELSRTIFARYPDREWASFARFGWREYDGGLVLTMAGIDPPSPGELDEQVEHVLIREPYSLRIALTAEQHDLAVAVVHSHPRDYRPVASVIDDDMDSYYAEYFGGFAAHRPYVSLIASIMDGEIALSGRVHWNDRWFAVDHFAVERTPTVTWTDGRVAPKEFEKRTRERFTEAFGEIALTRLRHSSVAVIGAGGSGSAAIEVLARAGVGRLIVVDSDEVSASNLERIHGSRRNHVVAGVSKVAVAKEHVQSIDPYCVFEGYIGSLPRERSSM